MRKFPRNTRNAEWRAGRGVPTEAAGGAASEWYETTHPAAPIAKIAGKIARRIAVEVHGRTRIARRFGKSEATR
jgi:hypothetical protein